MAEEEEEEEEEKEEKEEEEEASTGARHKRTPPSASKRIWLDSFLTPSARRVSGPNVLRTPGSRKRGGVSKLVFDETPEFLRRGGRRFAGTTITMAAGGKDREGGADGDADGDDEAVGHAVLRGKKKEEEEEEEEVVSWSPVAVRMPRKPAGMGLSVLVKGLRRLEEDMWDEEMDLLREVEAEVDGAGGPAKPKVQGVLLVADSQLGGGVEMRLGADGEGESEDEDEDEGEEVGLRIQGRGKVWKKKGQKRSTRRVVLKPVRGKWKPEAEWMGPRDVDEGDDDEVVRDTQLVGDAVAGQKNGEDGHEHAGTADEAVDSQATVGKKDGLVSAAVRSKKAPRKISSTAHANYRALKIKNKHSKGKGGGRYGRKR